MENKKSALTKSVQDLRETVAQSLPVESAILLNLIDALLVGPRPESAVETTLSPVWSSHYSNLYAAIERAGERLARDLSLAARLFADLYDLVVVFRVLAE